MTHPGLQVVAFCGGHSAASADSILKSWAPTRAKARAEKRRMEAEYDGRVVIRP